MRIELSKIKVGDLVAVTVTDKDGNTGWEPGNYAGTVEMVTKNCIVIDGDSIPPYFDRRTGCAWYNGSEFYPSGDLRDGPGPLVAYIGEDRSTLWQLQCLEIMGIKL